MLTRLKLLCVALFWGGTFVSAHVMGAFLPPPVSALLRFLVATAFMVGFAMFGSIVYLSIYLQVVYGSSPTVASPSSASGS